MNTADKLISRRLGEQALDFSQVKSSLKKTEGDLKKALDELDSLHTSVLGDSENAVILSGFGDASVLSSSTLKHMKEAMRSLSMLQKALSKVK